jgi:hypothetical protein
LAVIGCDVATDLRDKRRLVALVSCGASRAEVAHEFGEQYTSYEEGTPSWDGLETFLQRAPFCIAAVARERLEVPQGDVYTTMWRTTSFWTRRMSSRLLPVGAVRRGPWSQRRPGRDLPMTRRSGQTVEAVVGGGVGERGCLGLAAPFLRKRQIAQLSP